MFSLKIWSADRGILDWDDGGKGCKEQHLLDTCCGKNEMVHG